MGPAKFSEFFPKIKLVTYHLSDVVVEVESEDNHWHEQQDQPHQSDLGEDQEKEEDDQGAAEDDQNGAERSKVSGGQPSLN